MSDCTAIGLKTSLVQRANNELTDEKWHAIITNDEVYNHQFVYAVTTTKIFCKPSCKSRVPKKENVRIFQNEQQAIQNNFRPCKRCKPMNEHLPETEMVNVLSEYIERHFNTHLTLRKLAEIGRVSPYHMHRTFKKVKGVTPLAYVQHVRMLAAKTYLIETNESVAAIASSVGVTNVPYFIALFKKQTGQTPKQYRQSHR
ncbi:MAG: bifunctional transcriptional activator/DNA repair enzyme AdaA [Bacilli bacterium]